MFRYVLKRLLLSVPIFIGITALVFILANLAGGSPADVFASAGQLSQETYDTLMKSLGLDKPLIVRYIFWLSDLLRGNLGVSSFTNQSVAYTIGQRLGPTFILSAFAICMAVAVSVPMGIMAALKPYSVWDKISSAIAFVGVSMPNFFISLVLIYVAVKLSLLPAQGMYYLSDKSFGALMKHVLLPGTVLSVQQMGNYIKQTKGSVQEVLNEDYIKTARSKGIREARVVVRHALRNALMPIMTVIGMSVPTLMGGAVITEQIFGWPGIGSLMVTAVNTSDYAVIMGVTVLTAAVVIGINILLDIVYTLVDPRIKL